MHDDDDRQEVGRCSAGTLSANDAGKSQRQVHPQRRQHLGTIGVSSSFLQFDDAPGLTVLDRSTLERWAICPWQAKAIEDGRVNCWPELPETGEQIHQALSRAAIEWVLSEGLLSAVELRGIVEDELLGSRPDLQPGVIDGFKASLYSWTQFLLRVHPDNILGMDGGGPVGKSGQLSLDIRDMGVRLTTELDLLYAGDSREQLEELDYKTGWKVHTAGDVKQSFQFCQHAATVFHNYPECESLRVRIWNTRANQPTWPVEFTRDKLPHYLTRLRAAVKTRRHEYDAPTPWPTTEKCAWCNVAALCPVANEPLRNVATDPVGALSQLVAIDAKADALKKLLTAHVDKTKAEIIGDGIAFGRKKPSTRKATATTYTLDGDDE
jgi:hypothetical protein